MPVANEKSREHRESAAIAPEPMQQARDAHVLRLQQANEQLVISTFKAQNISDQRYRTLFDSIDDGFGHAVGDQLLQSVAKRLTAAVRSSDTVCRLGGDEFIVLLAEIEHARDAELGAENILAALMTTHRIDQFELQVTVSIGISLYPEHGQNMETLIKNADAAMYQAKAFGRNNYQFFRQM